MAAETGLGLDAGGTQTRWALALASGQTLAEGSVPPFSGTQVHTEAGRASIVQALGQIRQALQTAGLGLPAALWAGVTGHDEQSGDSLRQLMAASLGLPAARVQVHNDVELACRLCFEPGQGHVVYSGTGSIGVFIDAAGNLHRVGGRGGLLGDEGSGYWIARQALARVWRDEDDAPGSLASSALAQALFERIGGARWDDTRRFVHHSDRGALGTLALAVAQVADIDPTARQLLRQAGKELARLATLLIARHGMRPVVVGGRAATLHPFIEASFRDGLPPGADCEPRTWQPHRDAAVRAAGWPG
ncbi:MAG: N-acetylglucosamine kinase [Rubrivivax sp.]